VAKMRSKTEIKRMIRQLKNECIRGCHWFNMSLKWVICERDNINGYLFKKSAQNISIEQKARLMIRYLDEKDVWRKRYFIEPLEWALGDRDDIFGSELTEGTTEKVVFT